MYVSGFRAWSSSQCIQVSLFKFCYEVMIKNKVAGKVALFSELHLCYSIVIASG